MRLWLSVGEATGRGSRREGWLDLAIVLGLYSRRIIGWATSDRLKKGLALNALRRAIAVRHPEPGLIHHTDRGSQYCSHDYPLPYKFKESTGLTFNSSTALIYAPYASEGLDQVLGRCSDD